MIADPVIPSSKAPKAPKGPTAGAAAIAQHGSLAPIAWDRVWGHYWERRRAARMHMRRPGSDTAMIDSGYCLDSRGAE